MDYPALFFGHTRSDQHQHRNNVKCLKLWWISAHRLLPRRRVFLGARLEYIGTTGSNNLLYGPGSGAFAVTLTPAYQYRNFFFRGGFAWVRANNVTTGLGLGPSGTTNSQTRVTLDAGILF